MKALTATALLAAIAGTSHAQTTYTIPSAETPTLQFALESPTTPVVAGDTLELTEAGFYLSTYTVDIANLTIRAADGQSITVDGLGLGSVFNVTAAGNGAIFENLTITGGNSTNDGGGINAVDADVSIIGCTITGNSSDDDGAGVYISGATGFIDSCSFVNNTSNLPNSSDNGGGIMGFQADIYVSNSTFTSNTSNSHGGAMYFNDCMVEIFGCTLEGNSSQLGGGLAFVGGSTGTITDSTMFQNNATNDGGGIYSAASTPHFNRCVVIDNAAATEGGGVYVSGETDDELLMDNCIIARNNAANGGGILANTGPDPLLTNCTIVGNSASTAGGGAFNMGAGAGVKIRNCILRDNTPNQYPTGSSTAAWNCNVSGGELTNNTNIIDVDPMFVDAGNDDYRLSENSPSIDAGDAGFLNTQATPTDLAGNNRAVTAHDSMQSGLPIMNLYVDQGAYEFQPANISSCPADQNFDGMLSPTDFSAWIGNYNAGCD